MRRVVSGAAAACALACTDLPAKEGGPVGHQAVPLRLERDAAAPGTGPTEIMMAPSVAWVSDTSLAVVDVTDQQIVIYHAAGNELARLGRMGGGPGEFRGAAVVVGIETGGVVVADAALSRLSVFDAQGRFVRSVPLGGFPQHVLRVAGDDVTVIWTSPGPAGAGPVVGRIDSRTGVVRELFTIFDADSALATTSPVSGGPSPFIAAAVVDGGTIAIGEPSAYRIVIVDTLGRPKARFGRDDLKPEMPDKAEIARRETRMRQALRGIGRTPPPEVQQMMERAVQQPKPFFTVTSFAADGAGRLWVATTRGTRDSTALDVFSSAGQLVGTVVVPHRVRALAFRGRRCAVLIEHVDQAYDGQYAVALYRVLERSVQSQR